MNLLTAEMKRSLRELDLGLKGELTITSDMEDLSNSLFFDQVNLFLSLFIHNGWSAILHDSTQTKPKLLNSYLTFYFT